MRSKASSTVSANCRRPYSCRLIVPDAQHFPPVQDPVPVLPPINQDQVAPLQLPGLQQREHLPQFVHGAEAARKNDQGFGKLGEPQLTHEEVMKLEIEFGADVAVGPLLVRQLDAQADGFSSSLRPRRDWRPP